MVNRIIKAVDIGKDIFGDIIRSNRTGYRICPQLEPIFSFSEDALHDEPVSHVFGTFLTGEFYALAIKGSIGCSIPTRFACNSVLVSSLKWNHDYLSGMSWSRRLPQRVSKPVANVGTDVKVPWEIGRCNDALRLVHAETLETAVETYYNLLESWIKHNPRGWGVQWIVPMELCIRAINLLVAYQILEQRSMKSRASEINGIRARIERILGEHLADTYRRIEYGPYPRGNHYLYNLIGILIIETYRLDRGHYRDSISRCIELLLNELSYQVSADGSYFEPSTNYHYQATELIALLLNRIDKDKWFAELWESTIATMQSKSARHRTLSFTN